MRGVHFTILPASPGAADFYEIWHTRSSRRHNHVRQIFSRSFQGYGVLIPPKLPFPIDLLRRPYNSVALPCDTVIYTLFVSYAVLSIISTAYHLLSGSRAARLLLN